MIYGMFIKFLLYEGQKGGSRMEKFKHLSKMYIAISLICMIGYLWIMFSNIHFSLLILFALVVNLGLGIPFIIHINFENRKRLVIIRILKLIALSSITISMVLIYLIPREYHPASGWEFAIAWAGISLISLPIAIIEGIRIVGNENRETLNSLVLIFYLGLMMFSGMVTLMAIEF